MSRASRSLLVLCLLVLSLALGFQIGIRYERLQLTEERYRLSELFSGASGSGQVVQNDPEKEVDISLLWSVWRLLNRHYIDPSQLKVNTMVFGAVQGLVSAIGDPYTTFMTPSDSKDFTDALQGNLEGIGAQLELRDGQVIIVAPLKGSPAEKAGLLPLDVILTVDGMKMTGMKIEDVVKIVRGPKGTSVTIAILRKDDKQALTFTITRQAIHVPSVESKSIQTATGSIAYVAINQFSSSTTAEAREAVRSFKPKDVRGLILDLRFNGGGYLDGAVDIVSLFVSEGKVVTVEHRASPAQQHSVHGKPLLPDIPMAVLINSGSASASEIVAGALQDIQRAMIIGTQSFGKGTVQEILELPGDSMLRVTTAKWLTPSGHDLSKKGITPDIVVDRTEEQYREKMDTQLDAAIEWLTDGEDISKNRAAAPQSR